MSREALTITCKEDALRADKILKEDIVIFNVDGRELKYRCLGHFLSNISGSNSRVFDLLGLDKNDFCRRAYGRSIVGGDWPEYDGPTENRGLAMKNVVVVLYREIEKQAAQKDADKRKAEPGRIDTIRSLEDLLTVGPEGLKKNQRFNIAGQALYLTDSYFRLEPSHYSSNFDNLMKKLELTREGLIQAYGDDSNATDTQTWPEFPNGDMHAAYRAALLMFSRWEIIKSKMGMGQKDSCVTDIDIIEDAQSLIEKLTAERHELAKQCNDIERRRLYLKREINALHDAIKQAEAGEDW